MAFSRKLKMAPTTLPTIAGNASATFPASLLSASANLANHPSSFHEEPPLHEKLYNRVSDYVSLRMITPSNLEISGIIFPPII